MEIEHSEEEDSITYKIIMIGDSTVGKTCLFRKLTTGVYSDKNITSIGIDRKTFPLKVKINENGEEKEKNFLIQLWDTAGQERFRAITKGYIKDSQGLLLMYDITNKDSFDNIEKWITSIKDLIGKDEDKESEEKFLIFLMGNKKDLEEEGLRTVSEELAEEKCKNFNIIWGGECSAKNNTMEEIKEKFKFLTKEMFNYVGYYEPRKTIKVTKETKKTNENEKSKCSC